MNLKKAVKEELLLNQMQETMNKQIRNYLLPNTAKGCPNFLNYNELNSNRFMTAALTPKSKKKRTKSKVNKGAKKFFRKIVHSSASEESEDCEELPEDQDFLNNSSLSEDENIHR